MVRKEDEPAKLERKEAVLESLHDAAADLAIAADAATESEGGGTGLKGPTAHSIGALSEAVQNLALLLEDWAP